MTRKLFYTLMLSLGLICLLVVGAVGDEAEAKAEKKKEVKHEFVGAKKCKICHKEEFASWEKTGHAAAWELLDAEQQAGIECTGCHSTGTTAKGVFLEGVQCEACHGAAADYKKKTIMKDHEKALAAGLITPDSTLCATCHNENSPTFKGFNFHKHMAEVNGIHVMPAEDEEAEAEAAAEEAEG